VSVSYQKITEEIYNS